MRVTPDRIAYWGTLGNPTTRNLGAWTFYLACEKPFRLSVARASFTRQSFALVPPRAPHRIITDDRDIVQILVEPETVDGTLLEQLMSTAELRVDTARSIRNGFGQSQGEAPEFDCQYFGRPLPGRVMDPRIRRVCERLSGPAAPRLSAHDCAVQACLSFSRFMHLFSAEVQTTFRRYRAWRRARSLLVMMGGESSLVDVALDAGYADSTHFSRSVRRCYGYTPSAMFDSSRRLSVISQVAAPA